MNDFWWGGHPLTKGNDCLSLVSEKGFGSFNAFTVNNIGIVHCQIEKVNGDFLVPVVGSSCCKIGLDHLIIKIDFPHEHIVLVFLFPLLYCVVLHVAYY